MEGYLFPVMLVLILQGELIYVVIYTLNMKLALFQLMRLMVQEYKETMEYKVPMEHKG